MLILDDVPNVRFDSIFTKKDGVLTPIFNKHSSIALKLRTFLTQSTRSRISFVSTATTTESGVGRPPRSAMIMLRHKSFYFWNRYPVDRIEDPRKFARTPLMSVQGQRTLCEQTRNDMKNP